MAVDRIQNTTVYPPSSGLCCHSIAMGNSVVRNVAHGCIQDIDSFVEYWKSSRFLHREDFALSYNDYLDIA